METKNQPTAVQGAQQETSLTDLQKTLEKTCQNCNPLTPITCLTACKTWKLKNQFRRLHEKTRNPDFMTKLLNTLKNKRRLQLLEILSKEHYTLTRLQQKLKEQGFDHSQRTIAQEYMTPLIEVGLADQDQNMYYATMFGCKLGKLIKHFNNLQDVLPPHSECYEEITLDMLRRGSKTYEDLKSTIPAKSVARVLSRLQKTDLTEKTKEKDHIFFFTTKRDQEGSRLSPTERRVYKNIPADGISARKLAQTTEISVRRTYKYLRKLKGKKLVFTRKKPTSYTLTVKGAQMAMILEAIHNLAAEALTTTSELVEDEEIKEPSTPNNCLTRKKKKDETVVPLTIIQPIKQQ